MRKAAAAFLAGVGATLAVVAAAQCLDGLIPRVTIRDARTGVTLLECAVVVVVLDGHELRCDRRR